MTVLQQNKRIQPGWEASLKLQFSGRGHQTDMIGRSHRGPLRVQKALYPEGRHVCHAVILHPPGGIAGGDTLDIDLNVGAEAHVLMTTPGSGKWYRSGGRHARQQIKITVSSGGSMEWLPQETIFFNGVDATLTMEVELEQHASFIGLDTFCLGRIAAGEKFQEGVIRLNSKIIRKQVPLWHEYGILTGGSSWLNAAPGLAGHPFCATLLAAGTGLDAATLADCRAMVSNLNITNGITLLPDGLLVARCLGYNAEPVREWFVKLWTVLRPVLLHREAIVPRLWYT